MVKSSSLLRSLVYCSGLAVWLAATSAGCSFALSGPDPKRVAGTAPRCDSGKGLIWIDSIYGMTMGLAGGVAYFEGGGTASLVPMGISATYLLAAVLANGRVNRCREAFADLDEELRVSELLRIEKEEEAAAPAPAPTVASAAVTTAPSRPPVSSPQSPQEVLALARRYVIDGLAAHRAGLFDDAIALYRRAYELAPRPELLFNLAQVYRLKGELPAALDFYRKYLAIDETSELAIEASAWVSWLEGRLSAPAPSRASRSDGLPAPGVP